MWNEILFSKQIELIGDHFIYKKEKWGKENAHIFVLNIYAPLEFGRKKVLWNQLLELINSKHEANWCVMGGFNVVRSESGKKGDGYQ